MAIDLRKPLRPAGARARGTAIMTNVISRTRACHIYVADLWAFFDMLRIV
jgi:hypothetical protein